MAAVGFVILALAAWAIRTVLDAGMHRAVDRVLRAPVRRPPSNDNVPVEPDEPTAECWRHG